jgi:hypothetical protein
MMMDGGNGGGGDNDDGWGDPEAEPSGGAEPAQGADDQATETRKSRGDDDVIEIVI